MEWISDPSIWLGLATLVVLEIVLGVDNLIFIAILVGRLPAQQRERARIVGLSLALLMRLGLLAGISWVMSLAQPAFSALGQVISWRDLILISGGLFLLVKATTEIHERLAVRLPGHAAAPAAAAFWPAIAQIVVLDAVFSLDSVITAIGMVDELAVMMAAVIIAVAAMLVAARPLTEFIAKRPSLIILCLGFLLMVGLVLVVDGFGVHVPKGYVYAAISFSVLVEMLNEIGEHNRERFAASIPARRRAAYAILRIVGGAPASPLAPLPASVAPSAGVFAPLEQRMVRGVLELARRPITAVMTHRSSVDWIDAAAGGEAALDRLRASPYRALPVGRGSIDDLVGVVRKDDVLAVLLEDRPLALEKVMSEPVAVPASARVLDVFELFKRAPIELAVVTSEYGGCEGIVTRTDLLEAIAGDLPEQQGEAPELATLADGALAFDGTLALADLQQRLQLETLPEGRYQTAGGMVVTLLGRIAARGDAVDWQGWRIEVAAIEGNAIKRLVARRARTPRSPPGTS